MWRGVGPTREILGGSGGKNYVAPNSKDQGMGNMRFNDAEYLLSWKKITAKRDVAVGRPRLGGSRAWGFKERVTEKKVGASPGWPTIGIRKALIWGPLRICPGCQEESMQR